MKGIFSNPDGEKLSFKIKKISGVSSLELLQLLQVLQRPELRKSSLSLMLDI